jgi:zinc D-Ala-D-Ala carboxypeptidase
MPQRISKNISYKEATKSNTALRHGIDNNPNGLQLKRMVATANAVFQPVREYYGVPIAITSFYRSPELNRKIGGSSSSQHCKGEAIDMDADVYGDLTNKDIFYYIKNNLEFDQLIWEFGDDDQPAWVHVSYRQHGGNRNHVIQAYKEENWRGKLVTKYRRF